MTKVRVYELAKECNVPSKDLVQALKQVGIEVSSHMSTLDEEIANQIRAILITDSDRGTPPSPEPLPEVIPVDDEDFKDDLDLSDEEEKTLKLKRRPKKKPPEKSEKAPIKPKKLERKEPQEVALQAPITVKELAEQLDVSAAELIGKLMQLGVMANINQSIELDIATIVAEEMGYEVKLLEEEVVLDETTTDIDNPDRMTPRPSIVTVLGHVDHGKTSLLDQIRHSNVIEGEAGGITQHIGAYQVDIGDSKITFLDTPGHAAFTAMRARGAQVTDIVILVVAADDGVMPQTIEAINHAKAAKVPIIVAVNKIDLPDANPDRVKQQLSEYALIPEEWGGDTIFVNISALTGTGINDLLEAVVLVAELEEFMADPERLAEGTVVEAQIDKGLGRVATVIVQKGTLEVGTPIVAGMQFGRVKAMADSKGQRIKSAGPSMPVEIIGLEDLPEPGDRFTAFRDEKEAKQVAGERQERARQVELSKNQRMSLEDLYAQMGEDEMRELNLIVKADVQGSVEAIQGALAPIQNKEVKVHIVHTGVGAVNDTDIMLAKAANAIVVGFNVRAEATARKLAEIDGIELRFYRVIYNLIEDIEAAIKGLLAPEYEEVVLGQVEVRQTFKVPRVGTIAGCYVTTGKIQRNAGVRIIRQAVVIFEGKILSLKRFKDDVREVSEGYECGIGIEKFNDLKEGDIIEAFIIKEIIRD